MKTIKLSFLAKKKEELSFPSKMRFKKRKHGLIVLSKEAQKADSKIVMGVYKTIIHNLLKLESEQPLSCPQTGAIIKKENNGTVKGRNNQGTYSITLNNKKFFLKLSSSVRADLNRAGLLGSAKLIKKYFKNTTNSVRVITPHIIYLQNQKGIVVTDYIDTHEAISIHDALINPVKPLIPKEAIENFNRAQTLLKENGFYDIESHNAFYHFKTKNILLFDINCFDEFVV